MPRLLAAAVVICGLIGLPSACGLAADDAGTQSTPTTQANAGKGIEARRPEEFAFIAMVVKKVDNKSVLPRDLVGKHISLGPRQSAISPSSISARVLIIAPLKMGIKM